MAVRQLRMYNDEILKKRCKEVSSIDGKVKQLLEDMQDTLDTKPDAAGIAACQVGSLKRVVVIRTENGVLKMVNPKIVAEEGAQECLEGCLSFPGRVGKTNRPQKVTVQALDENGEEFTIEGEGELAKCFCHEIDHLDGKVFVDQVIEFIN